MLKSLNLPEYSFKFKKDGDAPQIFDEIRKKYVALTPEEWVRQHFLMYLVKEKKFPSSLLLVEASLRYNGMSRRADIVAYDQQGKPLLVVECKAPSVEINQQTFDQVARYNMVLDVSYLVVTNGMKHYCCLLEHGEKSYHFLEEIPDFKEIKNHPMKTGK